MHAGGISMSCIESFPALHTQMQDVPLVAFACILLRSTAQAGTDALSLRQQTNTMSFWVACASLNPKSIIYE